MNRREFIKKTGWSFLGLAASSSIFGKTLNFIQDEKQSISPVNNNLKMYWGDLHNHCNLTYGHGDMRSAFEAAKEQLDFVSVTPHALWPDIPGKGDSRLSWVIDYHTKAFKRLREYGWERYVKMTKEYNEENKFLTFLSYECHSMSHGDHVALNYDFDAPLLEANSIPNLREMLKGKKAYLTPHHLGYIKGYRGFNWEAFTPEMTPFVEMYSRHGLAESDDGDYDYLHDMGPRQWEGTVLYGLEKGYKFGIMGSTDQHAGYPGSYGDGRVGVLASSLSRENIWEALGKRHVCCATGDKILIDFRINDAVMGDVIKGAKRNIYVKIEGQSSIDYVDIIKNGKCIARMNGPLLPTIPNEDYVRCKVKINFGWNREEQYIHWKGKISVDQGTINDVTPCFRGAAFTSPQPGEKEFETKVNRVVASNSKDVELDMYSSKNPNTNTAAMQAVVLDVFMPKSGKIIAEFNSQKFEHSIGELLEGSRAHFMRGWLSEAIQFCRAIPENDFFIEHYMEDLKSERDTDYYYVRVRQHNQQWAWSSPIWVEKG